MRSGLRIIALAFLLTSCAGHDGGTEIWRDVAQPNGQKRSVGALNMDIAGCRTMVANAQANGPFSIPDVHDPYVARIGGSVASIMNTFTGPNFYDCMEAKGWEFEGYK